MDPFSAAAGTVSFVALSLQLADLVQKLYRFWSSVEAATDDIQTIMEDLHVLGTILAHITQHEQAQLSVLSASAQYHVCREVLKQCQSNLANLANIIHEVHPGFVDGKTKKRWVTFKLGLKRPQIERFQSLLEKTKTSLILEQLRVNGLRDSIFFSAIKNEITNLALIQAATIAASQSADIGNSRDRTAGETYSEENYMDTMEFLKGDGEVLLSMHMRRRSSLEKVKYRRKVSKHFRTYFGTVVLVLQVKSTQEFENLSGTSSSKGCEIHEWIVKVLPTGIFRWIFKSSIDLSLSWKASSSASSGLMSLQHGLRYYPAVPETAEIFEACRLGNIQWVQSLFNRKVASPFDTDPKGWTPLHVAAYTKHTDLCRLLIDLGANTNALTAFESNPLALACVGDRFDSVSLLNLVRMLIEYGGLDPTIQDSIGDDCLFHIRRSTTISKYIRLHNSIKVDRELTTDPGTALRWAVVDCACPKKIEMLLEQGADANEWNIGFRSESGPTLHSAASPLSPLQTTPDDLDSGARDKRINQIIVLVLKRGYDLSAIDDNLATAFDIVLEICRKWRYHRAITIWKAALEEAGIIWEEYICSERDLHAKRKRSEYLGGRDYYWSLQLQMDYWLSGEWEEEARERLFWNAERMDFDPVENSGGTYVPTAVELERRKSLDAGRDVILKDARSRLRVLSGNLLALTLISFGIVYFLWY